MNRRRIHSQRASVMITSVVAAAVVTILVGGFASYLSNEYVLNFRSHNWTQSLHMAEAAIEAGFAEFNYQYFKGGNGFTTDRGWSGSGSTYSKTVSNFTDATGKTVGGFTVTASGVGANNPTLQAVGTAKSALGSSTVSRAVKVVIANSTPFPLGLVSKNRIDLNGNNMYSDSFDSADTTKSTNGRYDVAKRQPNGDVGSNDTLIDTVDVGNADIYGKVFTGVGGTVEMGPSGSVGNTFVEADRATTVAEGESDGYIRHDFYTDIPDAERPPGSSFWWWVGDVNSDATFNGGDWKLGEVKLDGNETLTIQGNVRLFITGDTSLSGNAKIVISSNATLTVYSRGNMSLRGNGLVNNTGIAANAQFFGRPACTAIDISGNADWIGTIYAPSADLTVGGNGSVYGALVGKSVTLNGNGNFHYDEALKTTGGSIGYVVASWQELRWSGSSWVP